MIRYYKCCITTELIYEGIDLTKSNKSNERMICPNFFFNHGFKFQDYVCNGCHGLTMLSVNINDIAITTVENFDYNYIIYKIRKSDVTDLLNNSVLENRGYIYKILS